jgi:hypothetical protein
MRHTGSLAIAMFTWILGGESARGKDRKISAVPSFKNRGSVNGGDCDFSGDAGSFCQCPALSA